LEETSELARRIAELGHEKIEFDEAGGCGKQQNDRQRKCDG